MANEKTNTNNVYGRTVVPFTSGLLVIYAFFWPEGYGAWLGSIVHAFRTTSGL